MRDHCGREIGIGPRGKKAVVDLFWILLAFGMLLISIVIFADRAHAQSKIPIGSEQGCQNLLGRASGLDRGFRDVCGSSVRQPGLSNAHSSDAGGNLTKTGAPSVGVESSRHRFLDKTNIALFSGVAIARGFDLHSTWKMRRAGWQEVELGNGMVDNKPAFTVFTIGMVGAHVTGCYLLHRTGHHRLERTLSVLHIGSTSATVARNYWLAGRP